MALDVTDRKRLEEQLRQAQKMEAVGRLAGGIAHDFNNLLMVIQGYADLMRSGCRRRPAAAQRRANSDSGSAGNFAHPAIARVQPEANTRPESAEHAKRGRGHGRDFAATDRRGYSNLDVGATRPGAGEGRPQPDRTGDPESRGECARRHAQGGRLTIETPNVELDEASSHPPAMLTPGKYVMLAVTDNGCGMDAETQAHIFEPFFTTKEKGKGTGLGLATVYGIVKQSDGYIWVYSEPGRGTSFKVYLPRIEDEPNAPGRDSKTEAKALPRGSETVLLVEDEKGVRELAREYLETTGYTVIEAEMATRRWNWPPCTWDRYIY